jgi:hypothetical protein
VSRLCRVMILEPLDTGRGRWPSSSLDSRFPILCICCSVMFPGRDRFATLGYKCRLCYPELVSFGHSIDLVHLHLPAQDIFSCILSYSTTTIPVSDWSAHHCTASTHARAPITDISSSSTARVPPQVTLIHTRSHLARLALS